MTKRLLRIKSLMLMALRCEFIEGPKLTKKGKGFLSTEQWRKFNNIKCFLFPKWERDLISFLKSIEQNNKIEELQGR